jgi:hypothetical protein
VLIVLAVLPLGVVVYDALGKIAWVGSTELTIEFAVRDANSGQPIEGADLTVYAETERYLNGRDRTFHLKTDSDGVARYFIPEITCCGTQSNLRLFTDTRVVYTPAWTIVTTTAPGYQQPEPFDLQPSRYKRNFQRLGPRKDKLTIPIALHKSSP